MKEKKELQSEETPQAFFRRHKWPFLLFLLLIIISYLIISSDYNNIASDAGVYARQAKILYETNKFDISGSTAATMGQLLFSNIFCHLFGFSLRTLHISVYIANFFALIAMYLLLCELGINRFLAFFGSLTILVNPIFLKMIDWYMTEPFFMCYFIFSLLFFIKGLRLEKYRYLYLGGGFGILSILTRQHAISLSIALILLIILFRKRIKKGVFYHTLIASALPILGIGLFYLYFFINKKILSSSSYAANLAITKSLLNPFNLLYRLYFDTLYFLQYTVLSLAPLFIVLFLSFIIKPKRIKEILSPILIPCISLIFISFGILFLYIKNNTLMPYLSTSIFSLGALTTVFHYTVFNKSTAAALLTLFTGLGAVLLLITMVKYPLSQFIEQKASATPPRQGKKKVTPPRKHFEIKPEEYLIYLWGIVYIAVSILVGLRYDRYISPFSILAIFLILYRFPWIQELKISLIVVFVLIFSVFIFKTVEYRLSLDVESEADHYLLSQGIPSYEINGGLGFNNFYSLDAINTMYKDVKVERPINWHLFHPLANFFVTGNGALEGEKPGLTLYKSFTKEKYFGLLKSNIYIYKRKEDYRQAIWIN